MISFNTFVSKASAIHNNRYTYLKETFKGSSHPITIICPEHGKFIKTGSNHITLKQGCPHCTAAQRRCSFEDFVKRATKKHKSKYTYDKDSYISLSHKIKISCPEHGEFFQKAETHLKCGCPKCGYAQRDKSITKTFDFFVRKARNIHGDKYTYVREKFTSVSKPVTIICPIHGEFKQNGYNHLKNTGCKKCGILQRSKNDRIGFSTFVANARQIHGDKFTYDKNSYTTQTGDVTICCPKHGEFSIKAYTHTAGTGCRKCSSARSSYELQIEELLSSVTYKATDRTVIKPLELDFYLPELSLAIEIDGHFWHRELLISKEESIIKYSKCKEKGIRLITFYDVEIRDRLPAVKNIILNTLKQTSKLDARKLECKDVPLSEARLFLNTYHLQGWTPAFITKGLYHKEQLVSLMSFRHHKEGTELARYCSIANVRGGSARLLHSAKIRTKLVSFCDHRVFTGDMYSRLGFTLTKVYPYNFRYFHNNKMYHRMAFNKKELTRKFGITKDIIKNQEEHRFQKVWSIGYSRYDLFPT
jgi:very-short-patch-repair endonuclease